MIVLREAGSLREESYDLRFNVACAKMGIPVFEFSSAFRFTNEPPEIPKLPETRYPTRCLLQGYVMREGVYASMHEQLLRQNYHLLNTPEEHNQMMYFDKSYPLLRGHTPKSIMCDSWEKAGEAAKKIGYPVFVKGRVQSLKSRGVNACVATHPGELGSILYPLLEDENYTAILGSGGVAVREFVKIKHESKTEAGFPRGREYRLFYLDQKPVACAYYWEESDSMSQLSSVELEDVMDLSSIIANRFGGRIISIDIGQLESGEWFVVEVGDAQFSGFSPHISDRDLQDLLQWIQLSPIEQERT